MTSECGSNNYGGKKMLKYEEPTMEILIRKEDVITTSWKIDVDETGGEFGGSQGELWPIGN